MSRSRSYQRSRKGGDWCGFREAALDRKHADVDHHTAYEATAKIEPAIAVIDTRAALETIMAACEPDPDSYAGINSRAWSTTTIVRRRSPNRSVVFDILTDPDHEPVRTRRLRRGRKSCVEWGASVTVATRDR